MRLSLLTILLVSLLGFTACEKNVLSRKPTALFTFEVLNCEPPYRVQFHNESEGAESVQWDFGNGTGSTNSDPYAFFNDLSTVTLTAVGPGGKEDQLTLIVNPLESVLPATVDFHYSIGACAVPYPVSFYPTVNGHMDSAFWTIDGDTIPLMSSFSQTFDVEGSYEVSYTIFRCGEPRTVTKTLALFASQTYAEAEFSIDSDYEVGSNEFLSGAEVEFTNRSRYLSNFHWDFGDGHSSSAHSPDHEFSAGIYTVTLTGECHGDVYSYSETIEVRKPDAVVLKKVVLYDYPVPYDWDTVGSSHPDIYLQVAGYTTSVNSNVSTSACPSWNVNRTLHNIYGTYYVEVWDDDPGFSDEFIGEVDFRPSDLFNCYSGHYPDYVTIDENGVEVRLYLEYE